MNRSWIQHIKKENRMGKAWGCLARWLRRDRRIKLCKRCGRKESITILMGGISKRYFVICDFCLNKGPYGKDEAEAIKVWNEYNEN